MVKRLCSKSLCFVIAGSILILGVPVVFSESYCYNKNYKDETLTYTKKVDYDYYEYYKYMKYDYSYNYYSYYDSCEYKNYDYVLQNFLYHIFERYPFLEKLFDRLF